VLRSVIVASTTALLAVGAAGCSSGGGGGTPKGVQIPAKIASLKKAADQTTAKFLLSGMKGALRKKMHAVAYTDSGNSSRKVLVYGGTGIPIPPGSPSDQLKQMLASGTSTGTKVSSPTSVDAGSVGGKAECASIPGAKAINCGWISGKAALVMTFQGYDSHSAQSLVPQILSAMIRT
jgi:hypothetical protein